MDIFLGMQVDCTPVQAWFCGGVVARVDQYKSDGTWMRVQFLQVAGPGRPSHVAVRSSLMSVGSCHKPTCIDMSTASGMQVWWDGGSRHKCAQ